MTALPYREGVVKLPEGMTSEGVMLDGDHLVVTSKAMPVSPSSFCEQEEENREREDED